jgi:hypothetical protein
MTDLGLAFASGPIARQAKAASSAGALNNFMRQKFAGSGVKRKSINPSRSDKNPDKAGEA